MASITSIVSCLILLFITYSYSVPIKPEFENSTPFNEDSTGTTIVERESKINMQLVPDEESTGLPHVHKERTVDDEYTTPREPEHREEEESRSSRTVDEDVFYTSTPMTYPSETNIKRETSVKCENNEKCEVNDKREVNDKCENNDKCEVNDKRELSDKRETIDKCENNEKCEVNNKREVNDKCENGDKCEVNDKRELSDNCELNGKCETNDKRDVDDDYLFTTMDTKTKFDQRAISLDKDEPEIESSTSSKRDLVENDVEVTTDVHPSEEKPKEAEKRAYKDIQHSSKLISPSSLKDRQTNLIYASPNQRGRIY